MDRGALGKIFQDGEDIVKQGDKGDCMYVIQAGQVEVLKEIDGKTVRLAVRSEGDFFGEMALFEKEIRMATVRALGTARILTIDKKNFLRRIHQDPSLAYHLIKSMSARIRQLSEEVTSYKRRPAEADSRYEIVGPNP
jgi:CRP-like cAMP-binding protein